jgi:hypothetical protein
VKQSLSPLFCAIFLEKKRNSRHLKPYGRTNRAIGNAGVDIPRSVKKYITGTSNFFFSVSFTTEATQGGCYGLLKVTTQSETRDFQIKPSKFSTDRQYQN